MEIDEELSPAHHATKVLNTLKNTGTKESTTPITVEEKIPDQTSISCAVVADPALYDGVLQEDQTPITNQVIYVHDSTILQQQPITATLANVVNEKPAILHEETSISHTAEGLKFVNDTDIEVKHVPTYLNNQVVYYIDNIQKEGELSSTLEGTIIREAHDKIDENFISQTENELSNEKVINKADLLSSDDISQPISIMENTQTENEPSNCETMELDEIEECSISDTNSEELTELEEHTYGLHDPKQLLDVVNVSKAQEEPVPSSSHTFIDENTVEQEPCPSISQTTRATHSADSDTTKNEPQLKIRNNVALDGWTKDEKYFLYMGIKLKGSKKIKDIKVNIPHKTEQEIQAAINYYKERANNHPDCTMRKLKVRRTKTKPLIPLATWAKVLTDNFSFNELQTDIANAVRLIADLEDIPGPAYTEQIDFRKIYHDIADAMEGKSIPENRFITEVFNSCILDTALFSKQFILLSAFKHIVNSVNFKEKELPLFPRPTQDSELAIIRHLSALRNYNPLCITSEHLKPTTAMAVVRLRQKQKEQK